MDGNDSKRNATEQIPTVNEQRFRRERKLNEMERDEIGKVFLTPTADAKNGSHHRTVASSYKASTVLLQ